MTILAPKSLCWTLDTTRQIKDFKKKQAQNQSSGPGKKTKVEKTTKTSGVSEIVDLTDNLSTFIAGLEIMELPDQLLTSDQGRIKNQSSVLLNHRTAIANDPGN